MPYQKLDRDQLSLKNWVREKIRLILRKIYSGYTKTCKSFRIRMLNLIEKTADRIRLARKKQKSVMLAFGAHTIKNGMAPTLIALMEEGWVTHLATNGAGIIHDWEFAFQGKS